MLFDRPEPKRAVRTCPRQHNAHGKLASVFSQGEKETVNGHSAAARFSWGRHLQHAVLIVSVALGGMM
jgi:hypothetical protein